MIEAKNIKKIVDILQRGEKRPNEEAIGVEFEHIVVDRHTLESVNYYQERGIAVILKKLQDKGYLPVYEGKHLIGLEAPEGIITLEPGGQFELSIPPTSSLDKIEKRYLSFVADVVPILEEQEQLMLALGYHPKTSIKDIPFNPKKRYEYMSNYLKEKGTHAHNMMKGTAAIQIAIDYISQEDFIKKFRVANFLSPVLALISDNSPIFEGDIYNRSSIRSYIWENTDKARSGIVKGVMDQVFGYEEYAKYILEVPPILFIKDKEYLPTGDQTTAEVMAGNSLTEEEIEHLLTMVFPDVRAKRYIEIRMGDSLPYPLNIAFVALIKGLFYKAENLNSLYQASLEITDEELNNYKVDMMEQGLEANFMGEKIPTFINHLFALAENGLTIEEKIYLAPLKDLLQQGLTPAMMSKEIIKTEGLTGLKWVALNQLIGRDQCGNKEVICSL